jgi:hypothetical protein
MDKPYTEETVYFAALELAVVTLTAAAQKAIHAKDHDMTSACQLELARIISKRDELEAQLQQGGA